MSEIIRHGSIMQDVLEDGITPPDIVDKITVQHGSKMPESESTGGGSGGSGGDINVGIVVATLGDLGKPDEYGCFHTTYDIPFAELDAAIRAGKVVYARVPGNLAGVYNAAILIPMRGFNVNKGNIDAIHFASVHMEANDFDDNNVVTSTFNSMTYISLYPDNTAIYSGYECIINTAT